MSRSATEILQDVITKELMDSNSMREKGFIARALILATMPHSRVEGNTFARSNGKYTLTMNCAESGQLPYGTRPRIIMAYVCSQAVKKESRKIFLGKNITEFMELLSLNITGGRNGTIQAVREQIKRLFNANIFFRYDASESTENVEKKYRILNYRVNILSFWEEENRGDWQKWRSEVQLTEEFFYELMKHKVPFFMEAIRELQNSSFSMDIYMWLTWRMFSLQDPMSISWEALKNQFGSAVSRPDNFKKNFMIHLDKVLAIYPAQVNCNKYGLSLYPSLPHVPLIK